MRRTVIGCAASISALLLAGCTGGGSSARVASASAPIVAAAPLVLSAAAYVAAAASIDYYEIQSAELALERAAGPRQPRVRAEGAERASGDERAAVDGRAAAQPAADGEPDAGASGDARRAEGDARFRQYLSRATGDPASRKGSAFTAVSRRPGRARPCARSRAMPSRSCGKTSPRCGANQPACQARIASLGASSIQTLSVRLSRMTSSGTSSSASDQRDRGPQRQPPRGEEAERHHRDVATAN